MDFVNYGEETLGNSLGIASGISIADPLNKTYVILSDGAIQMGPTLEAIQFIGKHKLNLICLVDVNEVQLTGKTSEILNQDIFSIKNIFLNYGWKVHILDNPEDYLKLELDTQKPLVVLFKTIKGFGVKEFEEDPVKYHYHKLTMEELDDFTYRG